MSYEETLFTLTAENNGVLQTAVALEQGMSKTAFYQFIKKHQFEQVALGVYVSPDAWPDGMYTLHLRSKQAIFSHESALYLHDLTDREPTQHNITVKTGYNPAKLTADGVKTYSIKKELHDLGRMEMVTSFGHQVPCYDMERTICDVVRSRNGLELQTIQEALKFYVRRKDKNLRRLTQYAQALQVEHILRPYLDVLL